jgi:hypothetical protein
VLHSRGRHDLRCGRSGVKATGTGGMPGVRDASGSAHVSTATLFKSPIEHVLHAEALPLLAPAGAL